MLYIVQNNRAYHQEHMYLTAMAARRSRGIEKAHIGTTLTDPNIDFATVAQGFGVHGEGPVTDPNDGLLRPRWPDLYGVNADLSPAIEPARALRSDGRNRSRWDRDIWSTVHRARRGALALG